MNAYFLKSYLPYLILLGPIVHRNTYLKSQQNMGFRYLLISQEPQVHLVYFIFFSLIFSLDISSDVEMGDKQECQIFLLFFLSLFSASPSCLFFLRPQKYPFICTVVSLQKFNMCQSNQCTSCYSSYLHIIVVLILMPVQ